MGFYRLSLITLIAVYGLILVGGIVRSTGSGMGCPDWPKCFDQWVPPTDEAELPANYRDLYTSYRVRKNERFADYLSMLGFKETANRLRHDESIREETTFNATKTWIEYINRCVGVVVGFLTLAVFIGALTFWNADRSVAWLGILTFALVGFQGWIGSFVVSSNLTPWTITVHMLLAMSIVLMLIGLVVKTGKSDHRMVPSVPTMMLLIACIVVVLVQILLGTQVREAIDRVAMLARDTWIEEVGMDFIIHRSFSWVVLILHIGLVVRLVKTGIPSVFPLMLFLLVLSTILTGTGMAYFGVPPYLQPVHLLLATATFGIQVFLLFKMNRKQKFVLGR